jgi:uncharacterized protein (UPF0261 family)
MKRIQEGKTDRPSRGDRYGPPGGNGEQRFIPTSIVLLGTLDTKGDEIGYVRNIIEEKGHRAIVIDAGILGEPGISADFPREAVSFSGGREFAGLRQEASKSSDKRKLIQFMIDGAAKIVERLYREGQVDGILCLGGSMGMSIGLGAMKALPVGVPKLLVGTHFYTQYLGEADLTIMQSPTDIMGLNPITRVMLAQAAGAVCGMAEIRKPETKTRPLVALTGLGVTTPAVMNVQRRLEDIGYDTVVFHGNSEVMDQLVDNGLVDGILDLSPNELIRIFILEETPWRDSRLESAGRRGLPQVFVPGSLDMIVLRMAKDRIPERYKTRRINEHGPFITGVRTNRDELIRLAGIVADKLNRSAGPVAVMIPSGGFSAIDRKDFDFFDPEADQVFADELKKNLKNDIRCIIREAHLFDDAFLSELATVYDETARKKW